MTLFVLGLALAKPPEADVLQGTWALHMEVVTSNDVPLVGSMTSRALTIVRARLKREGQSWTLKHTVCGSNIRGPLMKARVPPSYTRAAGAKSYPVSLVPRDGELLLEADTGRFSAGFRSECELPRSADDPCVTDWDADGNPGATVQVKIPILPWSEVYLVQRNHVKLRGAVRSESRIEGALDVSDLGTTVIGASRRMLERSPSARIVPGASRFVMTRLADDAGCAEVLATPVTW